MNRFNLTHAAHTEIIPETPLDINERYLIIFGLRAGKAKVEKWIASRAPGEDPKSGYLFYNQATIDRFDRLIAEAYEWDASEIKGDRS